MAAIWRTRDPLGREIVLNEERRDHILTRHPALAARLDEIRTTVEQPDFITRDRRFGHRENVYRRTTSAPGWIKVVVHFRPIPPQGAWSGEVITAYYVDRRNAAEVTLWP